VIGMTDNEPIRERTYTWSDPALIAAEAMQMDGQAFFAAMAEGKIPPPPIAATMDMDALLVSPGQLVFSLTPQEFHYNPLGTMHGGVFATLLDSVCGCAVHASLPAGTFYTSLDLAVKFLRPVTVATGKITATGTVTHLGRRTALAEGRITDAAGKLYATATSSCLVFPIG
jgi:uncharacterized protein (TIGR00369 family)